MQALKLVERFARDSEVRFVFPSEVTARFWARRLLVSGRLKAVSLERFLSWDNFKKKVFLYPRERRPVNRAFRLLFSRSLLEQNARSPLFHELIPPRQAELSLAFSSSLVRILPTLKRILDLDFDRLPVGAGKRSDLLLLLRLYLDFLQTVGLFEPDYERPLLESGRARFLLFYPETLEDWPAYAPMIRGCPAIRVVSLEEEELPPETRLQTFETTAEEVGAVFNELERLVDGGLDPEEIFLSAARLPELEGLLRREAEKRELPVRMHGGRPLSSYAAARLFVRLREWARSDFGAGELKGILLNQALPWKESELNRRLALFGCRARILAGRDLWLEKIRAAGPDPDLEAAYRRLRAHVDRVLAAKDFRGLKTAVAVFTAELFDPSLWNPASRDVFSYAVRGLQELDEAANLCAQFSLSDPLAIWQEYMDQEIYVLKEEEQGIPILPFRLASGARPAHHFLVNASQEGTAMVVRRFPFLGPHEDDEGLYQTDLSPAHLKLALLSGERVSVSYARQGLFESHLPPSFFVAEGRIGPAAGGPGESAAAALDPYEAERRFWAGGAFPLRLYPLQRRGFEAARLSTLQPKSSDLAQEAVRSPELRDRLLAASQTPEGLLRITPTRLELFTGCPFSFLLRYGLKLAELAWEPSRQLEPIEHGALLHQVLQRFTEGILAAKEARNESARLRVLRMEKAVEQVLTAFLSRGFAPPEPLWSDEAGRIRDQAMGFLEAEMERGVVEVLYAERLFKREWPEDKLLLEGKVDRISRHNGGCAILDYKSGSLPARAEIFGPEPSSFQIPFYVLLLLEEGLPVQRAELYSAAKRKFFTVLDLDKSGQAEELKLVLEVLRQRVLDMALHLRSGRYPLEPAGGKACAFCLYPGICRDRFGGSPR